MTEPKKPDLFHLPKADCGILLVHGIGDHRESETLLTFGEPMVDWLREWMAGTHTRQGAGLPVEVRISEARLRASRTDSVSPAYALAEIVEVDEQRATLVKKTCLLAEAWWGDSVQPPDSLDLLGWLWYRGPLLIFAHFLLTPSADSATTFFRQMWATLLSFLVQFLASVAILASVIPVERVRQSIAGIVRTLTLTLGDSFVMLEQDFQRAALVKRVGDALDWLEARVGGVAVVAHSQGAALAHEMLAQRPGKPGNVKCFVGVGSGLEKLQFLRMVRYQRHALVSACLIAPFAALSLAAFVGWAVGPYPVWEFVAAILCFFAFIFLQVHITGELAKYRSRLVRDLQRADLGFQSWVELYATSDLVPMGRNSVLAEASCVRRKVTNFRSKISDHVTYFGNFHISVPRIWRSVAGCLELPVFKDGDHHRLNILERRHRWHTWARTICFGFAWIAGIVGIGVFRLPLYEIGKWLTLQLDSAGLTWVSSIFAKVGGWTELVGLGPATPAAAALGATVGVLAAAAWWVGFRTIWSACSTYRWRSACREVDFGSPRAWKDPWPWLVALMGALPIMLVTGVAAGWIRVESSAELGPLAVAGICYLGGGVLAAMLPGLAVDFCDDDRFADYREALMVMAVSYIWPIFGAVVGWMVWPGAKSAALLTWFGAGTGIVWIVALSLKIQRDREVRPWNPLKAAMFLLLPLALTMVAALRFGRAYPLLALVHAISLALVSLVLVGWEQRNLSYRREQARKS